MAESFLGIVADLSGGRGTASTSDSSKDCFLRIDRDNVDATIKKLAPELELELPYCDRLSFASMDDFHPDAIARRVPALSKLLEAREEVASPQTMRRLIEESGAVFEAVEDESSSEPPAKEASAAEPPATESEASLLDAILSGGDAPSGEDKPSASRAPVPKPTSRAVREFVDRLLEQAKIETVGQREVEEQEDWRTAIDEALGSFMREILHHPSFQRLEATWRGIWELVRQAETGSTLKILVLDISKDRIFEELTSESAEDDEEVRSTFERLVREQTAFPGSEPFTLLVGDFQLETSPRDLLVLWHFADVARLAEVPFVAQAGRSLIDLDLEKAGDSDKVREFWAELRASSCSQFLGLCFPRLLVRLPYGPRTSSTRSFNFNESVTVEEPRSYLWGNASLAVGQAFAAAFAADGWAYDVTRHSTLQGLPIHVYKAGGESVFQTPTETLMTEAMIDDLRQRGFVPVAGFKGRDTARLVRFQSIDGSRLSPG